MKHNNRSAVFFLGFLFLFFAAGLFLPEKKFSEQENRFLAGTPEFTLKKLWDGSYGKEYETYLSDQFPFRNAFVSVKTGTERALLQKDVNGVYFGKDGYLIEKFEPEDLMTEQLVKNLDCLAKAAAGFAELLGREHVNIMLVPSASQILREKLPAFAAPADQGEVVSELKKRLSHPDMLLPVEETLLPHREEPLYYKTDHHWTTRGAYLAYRLYCGAAGVTPWEEERFEKKVVSSDFYGTIESKVNIFAKPDEITLYLPDEPQEYKVFYDGLPKEHHTLYNEKALEGKDQYAVFLDGNHGLTRIVNQTAGSNNYLEDRRLLIVKDSYAHSFAPFAALNFSEVYMVDLRYFNMKLSDFAAQQEITDLLVLYQIPGFSKDKNIFKMVR